MLFVEPQGIFPLRKAFSLKPEGLRVTTALTVIKYYHVWEKREKITLKNENQVHTDSSGESLLLMMLC